MTSVGEGVEGLAGVEFGIGFFEDFVVSDYDGVGAHYEGVWVLCRED